MWLIVPVFEQQWASIVQTHRQHQALAKRPTQNKCTLGYLLSLDVSFSVTQPSNQQQTSDFSQFTGFIELSQISD